MKIRLTPMGRALLSLYIPSMIIGFGQGMVVPIIPILATRFDVSVGLAAQVVTIHMVGRTVSQIPSGIFIDRLGRKPGMIIGTILIAGGTIATGVTPYFVLLLVAQFVAGLGGSLWQLAREVSAVDLVRPDQRGRMMSSFYGISSVGTALGPLLGGVIADQINFQAVFFVYGAMALVVLIFSLMVRETATPRSAGPAPIFDWGKVREIAPYYRTTFIILNFATMTAMLRMSILNSMLPLFAGAHLGFSATQVGSLFGVVGFSSLVAIGPAGFLSDKLGRKFATVPAAILSAIAFLGFPFANTMGELLFFSVIVGASNGLASGTMSTSSYDIIPESGRAQLQALRRTVGEVGALGGPTAGGVISNAYNPGTSFLFFAPLHMVTALLLAFVAKETLVKRQKQQPSPTVSESGASEG